jgi:uncharacterized protein
VQIEYDEAKRAATISQRGLDFEDAAKLFAGPHFTFVDDRYAYGEARWISLGNLDGRTVAIVWTERKGVRRIISMRHAHAKEVENRSGGLA